MKVKLSNNKNVLAGLLLLTIGGIAFYMALEFPFGSAVRMGPGYFPRVLAGIMMGFGIIILGRGLLQAEAVKGVWGWKPLAFISASLVVFGWMMDQFGMIPSLVVMFFVSAYAGSEFKLKEVVILTVFLVILAYAVFIYGLGLPYPLFKGFGYGGY